jgi:nicotinamidase-related amidase
VDEHDSVKRALVDPADCALLVIDVQARLSAVMPEACRGQLFTNGSRLLRAASILRIPVLQSEQYPKGLGTTEPQLAVELPDTAQKFVKTCFSCYGATAFPEACRELDRRQIVAFGIETHVCVLQSVFDLANAGHQVFVVEDAVCSRRLEHHRNGIERMRSAGIAITNVESVLFEWLRDAEHEHFKAIAKLIKAGSH